MVCLGFEPGAAGWYSKTNALGYSGNPKYTDKFAMLGHTPTCQPMAALHSFSVGQCDQA